MNNYNYYPPGGYYPQPSYYPPYTYYDPQHYQVQQPMQQLVTVQQPMTDPMTAQQPMTVQHPTDLASLQPAFIQQINPESSASPSQSPPQHQVPDVTTSEKTWIATDGTINSTSSFPDYVEFLNEKTKFEKETNQTFVHRDSKSNKDGNATTHPYRYKKFSCMLWKKPENVKSKGLYLNKICNRI